MTAIPVKLFISAVKSGFFVYIFFYQLLLSVIKNSILQTKHPD